MAAELEAVKRGYAYVEMNERGHFFSEGNYDILGPPLTDGVDEFNWMSSQSWSNRKVGTIGCSSTAEWQMGVAGAGHSFLCRDDPAGLRRGRRQGRSLLRARQLVSRRSRADAVHRLDYRRAESDPPDVSSQHFAGRFDSRLESVRPGAAVAAGRLGEGAALSAGDGHHQIRRRPARNFRRQNAGRYGRRDDQEGSERSGLVQRRFVA